MQQLFHEGWIHKLAVVVQFFVVTIMFVEILWARGFVRDKR